MDFTEIKKQFSKEWGHDNQEQFREPEYGIIDPDAIADWFINKVITAPELHNR